MFSSYQHHEQLEDELYRDEEDDSDGSEADSELEFHLYSQLHYSCNAGEVSELEDKKKEMDENNTQDNHIITNGENLGHSSQSENCNRAEKKDTVQKEKEKKRTKNVKKDQSKSLRPVTTEFEEVIVIDSSPDVITLSEDDSSDETEGVCALKCRRIPKLCTSTPAQQVKKRGIDAAVPVNVSSSDSQSESEFQCVLGSSSSSSDSDDLENWMILGRGQQEGDQSISLNLDGVLRAKQKVSSCFLCGTVGHVVSACPYKHCNNCGLPGHLFNSCHERAYWHKQCRRCSMTGHFLDDCPEVWRQYHITIKKGPPVIHQENSRGRTPAYCYNCAKKGHFGHECRMQRMFNGTYPSTPFINYYDTTKDLKFRQDRIELKAKGLKNNDIIPSVLQSPSTPGPPRKKQKTCLEKRNHRQKGVARQSYKTDLPASSHIFFSDTPESISQTSKQPKHKIVSVEKPWKPKRPVPQSRDSLPRPKVVFDESDDFPRGGGEGEEVEKGKKGKKMKKNGQSLCWTDARRQKTNNNSVNQRKKKKTKKANTNMTNKMYPTDENLFVIKQRKRKR
ncbi:hypothetical protein WMY93_005829 [Mugilogobius chulae]|uniref:Zinc finger CCHC domain-containing protein 7 n=1 Tax=Mugilogobius chulae TaxID=88201 RepID=A0AAW0PRZ3_9GOBI